MDGNKKNGGGGRGRRGNKSYREQSRGIPPIPGFTLLNGTANLKGRGGEAFQDDSPCLNPRTVTNHPDDLYRLLPPDPSARPTLWGPVEQMKWNSCKSRRSRPVHRRFCIGAVMRPTYITRVKPRTSSLFQPRAAATPQTRPPTASFHRLTRLDSISSVFPDVCKCLCCMKLGKSNNWSF